MWCAPRYRQLYCKKNLPDNLLPRCPLLEKVFNDIDSSLDDIFYPPKFTKPPQPKSHREYKLTAIGLSIVASQHLSGIMITEQMSLGSMIVFGVTATTFIVQIAGPPMVKLAVKLARENNRNVTEYDIINSLTVTDVMDTDVAAVSDTEPVENIIKLFATRHYPSYPVVDAAGKLIGVISLDNIKGVLLENQCWNWLLAEDVLVPIEQKIYAGLSLKTAIQILQASGLNQIPVLASIDNEEPVGILDLQRTRSIVQGRLIRAQSSA